MIQIFSYINFPFVKSPIKTELKNIWIVSNDVNDPDKTLHYASIFYDKYVIS
jgi:hypothetical protein